MILTCPACATRYQADEAKFPPGGRQVRCAKCGHVWLQQAPPPEPAQEPLVEAAAAPDPNAAQASAAAPIAAQAKGAAASRPVLPVFGVVLGWLGLAAILLLIGYCALRYRQEIVVIWPQAQSVYAALGIPMEGHGINFAHVGYRREQDEGQVVLAVTGQIVNTGSRELPVPQDVRVTLSDANDHELYHWEFTPSVQTLKPGQSVPFLTRLPAPPPAARRLEVRFAQGGK